ncbi:MAG: rhomboid family intramembrane serine protease [Acidobacteria bacterium]|nr:rhomboid family intramembrane serine protease [Acidobacteriota bacterium]
MIPLKDVIPTRTWPAVTYALIALNVAVFLLQSTLGPEALENFIQQYGLVPARFSVASMFTSMFVHGGLGHVGGNLLYLWIFGDNIEDRLGHGRFLVFYLATGIVAALSQTWMDPASTIPMVGASGAIAGVMGGYFVLYPHSRVLTLFPFPVMLFEVPAVFFLGLWFVVQFLNGVGSLAAAAGDIPGGVAFWAHVMGFVAGFVLVRVMQRPERAKVEWWGN